MLTDRFHGQHSTDSAAAVAALEDAVYAVAAHRPVGNALTLAVAADPDFIAAHTLSGFGAVMLGRAETAIQAKAACEAVETALKAVRHPTAGERALIEALRLAVHGATRGAAERLEAHLQSTPEDFLAAKIAHALRFMLGDRREMLRLTGDLVERAPANSPAYGFLLGCHAFGLEEAGAYAEAEAAGMKAVSAEPADSWGLHAVSHVYEMTGRVQDGRDWLNASRPVWSRCNNFSFHMAWHLALLHLEAGDHDRVLSLYDEEIRPVQTDDFRDMANAVSTLWRLEQDGVDVGDRWEALHEIAHGRRADTTYVFASLHYLLALIAMDDREAAGELVSAMRQRQGDRCDQGRVARDVGVRAAEAILSLADCRSGSRENLSEIAHRLPALGGSHAQRDVFLRTLMSIAVRNDDAASLGVIGELRCRQRREDRFQRAITARLESGCGELRPGPGGHDHTPAWPD
jgi:hypothetical protein